MNYVEIRRLFCENRCEVVLLPGNVLVKITDKYGNESREWLAEVLLREEIQRKRLGVYKFGIYQEYVESQRAGENAHKVET